MICYSSATTLTIFDAAHYLIIESGLFDLILALHLKKPSIQFITAMTCLLVLCLRLGLRHMAHWRSVHFLVRIAGIFLSNFSELLLWLLLILSNQNGCNSLAVNAIVCAPLIGYCLKSEIEFFYFWRGHEGGLIAYLREFFESKISS